MGNEVQQKIVVTTGNGSFPKPAATVNAPLGPKYGLDADGLPLTPAERLAQDKRNTPQSSGLIETPDDAVRILNDFKEGYRNNIYRVTANKQPAVVPIPPEVASYLVAAGLTAVNPVGRRAESGNSTLIQGMETLIRDLTAQMDPADLKVIADTFTKKNGKNVLLDPAVMLQGDIAQLTDQDPYSPKRIERPVKAWDVLVAKANGYPIPAEKPALPVPAGTVQPAPNEPTPASPQPPAALPGPVVPAPLPANARTTGP